MDWSSQKFDHVLQVDIEDKEKLKMLSSLALNGAAEIPGVNDMRPNRGAMAKLSFSEQASDSIQHLPYRRFSQRLTLRR